MIIGHLFFYTYYMVPGTFIKRLHFEVLPRYFSPLRNTFYCQNLFFLRSVYLNMENEITTKDLRQDIAELLDYLMTFNEKDWNRMFIRATLINNMERFDSIIDSYVMPNDPETVSKLLYNKNDLDDLVGSLTERYYLLDKLELKELELA
jgi:hypothetical protein